MFNRLCLTLVAVGLGIFVLSATASTAKANTGGYICSMNLDLEAYGAGDHGNIFLTVYSGKSCTGSFEGIVRFCSAGATWTSSCDLDNLLENQQAVLQVFAVLERMITWNTRFAFYDSGWTYQILAHDR